MEIGLKSASQVQKVLDLGVLFREPTLHSGRCVNGPLIYTPALSPYSSLHKFHYPGSLDRSSPDNHRAAAGLTPEKLPG